MEAPINWKAAASQFAGFCGIVAGAAIARPILRALGLYDFTAHEVEGLNTVILLVGGIYSVMLAFVIFVIWGQFTEVETFAMRECNTLNDLLRFSYYLNPDAGRQTRRAVCDYADGVAKHEWKALAERRRDSQSEKAFAELMRIAIELQPATPTESLIHERLIDVARRSGEHRDERIAKSLTRIPPTLTRLVSTMAAVLLVLVLVYPFHHTAVGLACFVLVGLVLFLAWLVMTDTDNPFDGICNITPQGFRDLGQ